MVLNQYQLWKYMTKAYTPKSNIFESYELVLFLQIVTD